MSTKRRTLAQVLRYLAINAMIAIAELNQFHHAQRTRRATQPIENGSEGNIGGPLDRITINPGADGRKADARDLVFFSQVETSCIAGL